MTYIYLYLTWGHFFSHGILVWPWPVIYSHNQAEEKKTGDWGGGYDIYGMVILNTVQRHAPVQTGDRYSILAVIRKNATIYIYTRQYK